MEPGRKGGPTNFTPVLTMWSEWGRLVWAEGRRADGRTDGRTDGLYPILVLCPLLGLPPPLLLGRLSPREGGVAGRKERWD